MTCLLPRGIHRVDVLAHVEPHGDLGQVAGGDGVMEGARHGDGVTRPSLTLTLRLGHSDPQRGRLGQD